MKFRIERNFLVRTEEYVEIDPKNFLHCANIMELKDELEDYISNLCEHPKHPNLLYSEELGCTYNDYWFNSDFNENSFYLEWQKLKGLPQEF